MTKQETAEPTTVVPEEVVKEPVTEPVTEAPKDTEKDAEFWKGKAKAMETDAKKAAKRLAELEAAEQARREAELSEIDKAKLRAEAAEKKAIEAELKVLRRDAIANTGLPAAFADRLRGETLEDMEADAKLLLASMPAQNPPKLNTTNPSGDQTGETEAQKRKRLGFA